MTCTKAQLLAIVSYIRKEVATAKDKEEALARVDKVLDVIESMAMADVVRELGLF